MKKLSVAINLPDNGGITFFGPLMSPPTTKQVHDGGHYSRQRMYICASQDPLEVGQTLMAMLADLQMSDKPIAETDLEREIGEIQF
jgi:hypothetical protein